MIQESINNLIFSAGINARLLPSYKRMMEAQDILGKARSAQAGITDLQRALSDETKSFSETEYNDMRKRLSSLNRDFYTAKIRSHAGDPLQKYLKKGVDELMDQTELSPMIKSVEALLDAREAGGIPESPSAMTELMFPALAPGKGNEIYPTTGDTQKDNLENIANSTISGFNSLGRIEERAPENRFQDAFEKEVMARQAMGFKNQPLALPAGEEKLALNPGQQPLALPPGKQPLALPPGKQPSLLNPGKGMLDGYVASPREKAMNSFEEKGVFALDQKNKFLNDVKALQENAENLVNKFGEDKKLGRKSYFDVIIGPEKPVLNDRLKGGK